MSAAQFGELTALGGTLIRWGQDQWAWSDHAPAPQVRDMTLSWYYHFRVIAYADGQYVEVPVNQARDEEDLRWVRSGGYTRGRSSADTGPREIHLDGRVTRMTTRDGGKAIRHVYLVPVADWDARSASHPVGAQWDKADEAAILDRARKLGWEGNQ